jgi:lipopolysaccharide export system protein LptA
MKASGRALVQGPDFWGRAETVTYNEEKDQLIFDGGANGMATLARIGPKGAVPDGVIQGNRITYIKTTGDYKVDGGRWVTGK